LLTRPDFVLLIGPLEIFVAATTLRRGEFIRPLIGLSPAFFWLAFAQFYYGSVVPNTAVTKLGIYTISQGIHHGLLYLCDWVFFEPGSALATLVLSATAVAGTKRWPERLLMLGAALYLAGVVAAGGDFMRGRMMLPVFFLTVLMGTFSLADKASHLGAIRPPRTWLVAAATCLILFAIAPPQSRNLSGVGIVNERLFYDAQSLGYYLQHGEIRRGTPLISNSMIEAMREFSDRCGTYGLHEVRIGNLAYYSGPNVQVIDYIGLTDAYVARLPSSYLEEEDPRPGHPVRKVPVSYLARRSDIRLFANWQDAVLAGDCRIITAAQSLASADDFFFLLSTSGTQRLYLPE
jgi:arabinofuranosyltransferase